MVLRNTQGFWLVSAVALLMSASCETTEKRVDWTVCAEGFEACEVGKYCTGAGGADPWKCAAIPTGEEGNFDCEDVQDDKASPSGKSQVCKRKNLDAGTSDSGAGGTGGGGMGGGGTGTGGTVVMPECSGDADTSCMMKNAAVPYCVSNKCVACRMNKDCGMDAPACVAGVCKKCDAAGEPAANDAVCKDRDEKAPFCGSKGECVECKSSAQCGAADKPICNAAGACEGCIANTQCEAKGGAATTRGEEPPAPVGQLRRVRLITTMGVAE